MAGHEITVQAVGWSETVRDHLCNVVDWPDHMSPDHYRDLMTKGEIQALGVFSDGGRIGTTFYKIEHGDLGQEFVILASAGHLPGVDLVAVVLPFMERLAMDMGCSCAAFLTSRLGLVKKTAGLGYSLGQTAMRKSLGSAE